jgi:ClpP class serine protease
MWREVQLLKERGKKVIISMGNVCASGGMYVASAGSVFILFFVPFFSSFFFS